MKNGYEQNNNSKSSFCGYQWTEEPLASIRVGLFIKTNENRVSML